MNFSSLHILVLGDVMLDEYIDTRVSRISPEAPVPVAAVKNRWHVAGGAANVARNLARLGCKVTLVGLCGQDEAGKILAEVLEKEGVSNRLYASDACPTIQKTRIIAQNQQVLRLDEEKPCPLTAEQHSALLATLQDLVPKCHGIVLSDYAKGVLLKAGETCLAQEAIAMAKTAKVPVCVDPKGRDWERYAGASCVTPNTLEFETVVGHVVSGREEMDAEATRLCEKYSIEHLLVTRGSKGMALFENGAPAIFIKTKAKEVIDVSGAGDTVISVLSACRSLGKSWADAASFSNMAAGVVVSKAGTSPITKKEFDELLAPGENSPKMVGQSELAEMLIAWRRNGDSIVFTNGCFDLLHKGHIRLINEAATQGDRLIVALNTDTSARRLKGEGRPVQDEHSRALLAAALEKVDAVILFEEDSPVELIRAIKPDVLVKGSDYTVQTVVGSELILPYGGRVHLVELVEGVSTDELLSRIERGLFCQAPRS